MLCVVTPELAHFHYPMRNAAEKAHVCTQQVKSLTPGTQVAEFT